MTDMHFSKTLFGLGFSVGSARGVSVLTVTNQCSENIHVVYGNEQYRAATVNLASRRDFAVLLSGEGYSVGSSTDLNFYSAKVPKLIFVFPDNTTNGLLYYNIAADYGNPFAGQSFALTGDNSQCTPVTSPNRVTYACSDSSSFTFVACG
ncbi:hypothetical protein PSPO01_12789 [Paraphaeosphaeria sporulosa]